MISLKNHVTRRGLVFMVALVGPAGCGGGGAATSSNTATTTTGGGSTVVSAGGNVVPMQVNAGPAGNNANVALVSVTICVPGTGNCQTIPDVQVDTGSTGLRLLASRVTLNLPMAASPVHNCVSFLDMSYMWGPVVTADVQMAGEKASSVPIQVVGGPGAVAAPSDCSSGGTPADNITDLGANGILGVGNFREDCGASCAGAVSRVPAVYFSCTSSGCARVSVPLQNQLQNPVRLFAQDNNGLMLSLPSIPATGAVSVSGSLIFGIGTQSNNALGSARTYTTDGVGNFRTTLNNRVYSDSFLDSGSSGIYFLDSATTGLPACTGNATGFYCPPQTTSFSASTAGINGVTSQVSFDVANANVLFRSPNVAFNNIAGDNAGGFDWGLPFFFGRNVFIGIEGQTSPAGTGPYWAY